MPPAELVLGERPKIPGHFFRLAEFLIASVENQLPIQVKDFPCEPAHRPHIMGYQEDRDAFLFIERFENTIKLIPDLRVQRAGRLIQDEHPG
jgi:hypothetical protein